MTAIKIINTVVMILFMICYAHQFVYIPISLLRKDPKLPEGKANRFAVLTAARNESAVIGELIRSIQGQTYPSELIDIYVIADNCTDNTAEVARAEGATVFERFNKDQVGKGYAMEFLLNKIQKRYDAYIVFDADNVVDPYYIAEINKTFSSGYDIVTSYRNSKNYGDNWISAGYALWFLREAQYQNRPRTLIGSSANIAGTGFLFSHRILEKCGGWHFHLLTEDVEFTADNITRGEKVGYCRSAVFYDEQPTNFRQSIRQRTRWVQGYMQVLRSHGMDLIQETLHGNFACFDMLMNIAPAMILTWVSILLNGIAGGIALLNGESFGNLLLYGIQGLVLLCLLVFAIGALTLVTEWKEIKATTGEKMLSAFTFPLFMLTYLPATVAALFCEPCWKPIDHTKTISVDDLS